MGQLGSEEQGTKIWGSERMYRTRMDRWRGVCILQAGLGDTTTCFSCSAGERTASILEETADQGQRQEETWQALALHIEAARAVTFHRPPRSTATLLSPGNNDRMGDSEPLLQSRAQAGARSGCFQLESLPRLPRSWKYRKSGFEPLKQGHLRLAGGRSKCV